MSNTPEQEAYLALLRLPHNGPRSTQALQTAMATLRDHIAEASGKDPELVQDLAEQVTKITASLTTPSFGPLAAGDDVERVAKAICNSISIDEDGGTCTCDFDGGTCCAMDLFGVQARAAIAALPQAAVKARMAVVDEKALEVAWRDYVLTGMKRAGDFREPTASDWRDMHKSGASSQAVIRAAITAYLAAAGG